MIICANCHKEMRCYKTGLGARFGESHVYPGDAFECKDCGAKVIKTIDVPVQDPKRYINAIQMEEQ